MINKTQIEYYHKNGFLVIEDLIPKNKLQKLPKLPVFTNEEGIKQIRKNLDNLIDWKNIFELIPKFYSENKMKKTGIAGIFAACLELTKERVISISQTKNFNKLIIKKF